MSAKAVDDQLIDELVHRAQAEGLQLAGEGGLLQQLTKRLLESALEGEITDHLGYDKHDAAGKIARLLKPIYTAPTEEAALDRFAEFADAWGRKYPAIVKLWENAWEEFTPFLRFDTEIRRIVCTTNAIESVNALIRRAVKARGHFPTSRPP